jgi:hypothetical protein
VAIPYPGNLALVHVNDAFLTSAGCLDEGRPNFYDIFDKMDTNLSTYVKSCYKIENVLINLAGAEHQHSVCPLGVRVGIL